MKLIILLTAVFGFSASAEYVNGYTRQNGIVVQGYNRTAADSSRFNNYSTQGNVNPYNGNVGTVNPYQQPVPQAKPFKGWGR